MKKVPLLTRMKEKDDKGHVGVYVPLHIFNFVNLYCIAKKISKAEILRPYLEEWVEERKNEGIDEKDLILEIMDLVTQRWAYEKINNRKHDPFIFRAKMKRELIKKGLPAYYIEIIIKTIK